MIPFPLTDVRILSQRVKEENERGGEEEETAELRIVMFGVDPPDIHVGVVCKSFCQQKRILINTLLVIIFGEDAHRFNKTDTVKRVIFTFNEGTTVNSYTSSSSGSFISFKKNIIKIHQSMEIHCYRDILCKKKMSETFTFVEYNDDLVVVNHVCTFFGFPVILQLQKESEKRIRMEFVVQQVLGLGLGFQFLIFLDPSNMHILFSLINARK